MTEMSEALRNSDNVEVQRVGYWLAALERDIAAFLASSDCVDRRNEMATCYHTVLYLKTALRDAKGSL